MDECRVGSRMPTSETEPAKPERDVDILLTPPLVAHVVAVDLNEVGPRDTEQVSVSAARRLVFRESGLANSSPIARGEGNERRGLTPQVQPPRATPMLNRQLLRENTRRQLPRELHAPAGNEPPRPSARAERPYEVTPWNRLAVNDHEVLSVRREDSEVEYPCEPEAGIRLPHVRETTAEVGAPVLDDSCRWVPGAIVGDDDVEVGIRLIRERSKNRIERVVPLVGANDDRDTRSRPIAASPPQMTLTAPPASTQAAA